MPRTPWIRRLLILTGSVLLAVLLTPDDTRLAIISLLASHRFTIYYALLIAATADILFLIISWRRQYRARYFFAREGARNNVLSALRILFLLLIVTLLVFLLPHSVS